MRREAEMSKTRAVDITVDMDKRCDECGKEGATPAGLCLTCAAKAASGVKMMSAAGRRVQRRLVGEDAGVSGVKAEAREVVQKRLAELVERNWPRICARMGAAAIEAAKHGKGKFKYAVGLKLGLEPRGEEWRVAVGIGFGDKETDGTDWETVGGTPLLDRMTEKKGEGEG